MTARVEEGQRKRVHNRPIETKQIDGGPGIRRTNRKTHFIKS